MLKHDRSKVEAAKEILSGLITDYENIFEEDKASLSPLEPAQEKEKFLDDLNDFENELEDLQENSDMAIDDLKSAYNKLYNLELWDFFNDATSEPEMARLQEILDGVMGEIERVTDFITE